MNSWTKKGSDESRLHLAQIALHFASSAAVPAGERDVRMEGSALGLEADGLAGALDLGRER